MREAELIANIAEIIGAALAVGAIIFHFGYLWSALNWLKQNAVTKDELIAFGATIGEKSACRLDTITAQIHEEFVQLELCHQKHQDLERRIRVLEDSR